MGGPLTRRWKRAADYTLQPTSPSPNSPARANAAQRATSPPRPQRLQFAARKAAALAGFAASCVFRQASLRCELLRSGKLHAGPFGLVDAAAPTGDVFAEHTAEAAGLIGKRFPQPGLLFKVSGRDLWVRALAEGRRPNAGTLLRTAPYWNCADSGKVCQGSMRSPDAATSLESMDMCGANDLPVVARILQDIGVLGLFNTLQNLLALVWYLLERR